MMANAFYQKVFDVVSERLILLSLSALLLISISVYVSFEQFVVDWLRWNTYEISSKKIYENRKTYQKILNSEDVQVIEQIPSCGTSSKGESRVQNDLYTVFDIQIHPHDLDSLLIDSHYQPIDTMIFFGKKKPEACISYNETTLHLTSIQKWMEKDTINLSIGIKGMANSLAIDGMSNLNDRLIWAFINVVAILSFVSFSFLLISHSKIVANLRKIEALESLNCEQETALETLKNENEKQTRSLKSISRIVKNLYQHAQGEAVLTTSTFSDIDIEDDLETSDDEVDKKASVQNISPSENSLSSFGNQMRALLKEE